MLDNHRSDNSLSFPDRKLLSRTSLNNVVGGSVDNLNNILLLEDPGYPLTSSRNTLDISGGCQVLDRSRADDSLSRSSETIWNNLDGKGNRWQSLLNKYEDPLDISIRQRAVISSDHSRTSWTNTFDNSYHFGLRSSNVDTNDVSGSDRGGKKETETTTSGYINNGEGDVTDVYKCQDDIAAILKNFMEG